MRSIAILTVQRERNELGASQITISVTYTNNALFTAEEQATLAHAADILKAKLIISEQLVLTSPNMVKSFCQYLTGGKTKLFGMSKRGNKNLRTLFIHGARIALSRIETTGKVFGNWLVNLRATSYQQRYVGANIV